MLAELHVRDLALVEDVWLEFGPGLTVLTGETGAGKTVVVAALKLLLGERADVTLVRQGADEAIIEGRFVIDGRDVVVKRRLSAEGRSRCTVDGEMATVTMLADILGGHVDLHGQHEHQALLSSSRHAGYLDRFIGADADRAFGAYREAWSAAAEARRELERVTTALADRDRRSDYLRFVVSDIDGVAPREGEDAELEAMLPRLRHGDRLAQASGASWAALRDDEGASDRLGEAGAVLGQVRGLDPVLDALIERVGSLDVELQDVAAALRDYTDSVEHDPAALDATERRLQQLVDLKHRYGPSLADAIAARDAAADELAVLDAGEEGLERARASVTRAESELHEAGEGLRALRRSGSAEFVRSLTASAAELALPHAKFEVSIEELPFGSWTADGPDRVEFLFASGVGEAPRPLGKVASGGELSRVMLALKSVFGAADAVPVLVFDEVDAGIGGATAIAVGRRLASVAADHQVLVITHLPQVAAFADAHVVVAKAESDGRTVTTARPVEGDDLVAEIARMLSGSSTETSIAHARELLGEAHAGAAHSRAASGNESNTKG